jgi:hypothetical protein
MVDLTKSDASQRAVGTGLFPWTKGTKPKTLSRIGTTNLAKGVSWRMLIEHLCHTQCYTTKEMTNHLRKKEINSSALTGLTNKG